MINVIDDASYVPGLVAVSDRTPPLELPTDGEVDLEVLRSIPKQFSIGDQETANWLVKKVMAARQYAANVKKWAELELKRAEREEHCLLFLLAGRSRIGPKKRSNNVVERESQSLFQPVLLAFDPSVLHFRLMMKRLC